MEEWNSGKMERKNISRRLKQLIKSLQKKMKEGNRDGTLYYPEEPFFVSYVEKEAC